MQTRPSKTNERLNPSADFAPRSFDCSEFYEITESERSLPVLEIRKKLQCCILYMTVRYGTARRGAPLYAPRRPTRWVGCYILGDTSRTFLHRRTQPYMASSMSLGTSRSHLLFILSIISHNLLW